MFDAKRVEASWYGGAQLDWTLRTALHLLSGIYGSVVALRRCLYAVGWFKQTRLPVPVIVVGNLIVGGAGKTPLTRALAQQLRAAGWRPGIISRGYGRQTRGVYAAQPGDHPDQVGDEPLLYAADGLPVFVGEQRAAAGQALLAAHPEVNVLIADDGLQHTALARDLELVVFDRRGIGNGCLLPAGPLREGLARLRQATVKAVVQQGTVENTALADAIADLSRHQMTLEPGPVYALHDRSQTRPLTDFAGQTVIALAGIGHPPRYFDMLRAHGLNVAERAFPDHHVYTLADLPQTTLPVLLTEKDAVKCLALTAGMQHANYFVVPVTARLTPPLPLAQWLAETGQPFTQISEI